MTDPFKDFLEELERRRRGDDTAAAPGADEAEGDAPPPARPRARRPSSGSGVNFTRPKLSLR